MPTKQKRGAEAAAGFGFKDLSGHPDWQKTINGVKREVLDTATMFGKVKGRISELAYKVIPLFLTIKAAFAAERKQFSLADFARCFDPTVPTFADDDNKVIGYRNHPAYYTIQGMKKIVDGGRGTATKTPEQTAGVDYLARMLATIIQTLDATMTRALWAGIQLEMGLTNATLSKLQTRVAATKPLVVLSVTKHGIAVGHVVPMPKPVKKGEAPTAETVEGLRQAAADLGVAGARVQRGRQRRAA